MFMWSFNQLKMEAEVQQGSWFGPELRRYSYLFPTTVTVFVFQVQVCYSEWQMDMNAFSATEETEEGMQC